MKSKATRILAVLFLVLLISLPGAYAGVLENQSELDALLERYMSSCALTGLEVAVSVDGEMVYQRGLGKTPEDYPVTADTPMYIGSVSKSFTALAIMQLAERGLVDLDASVSNYIPWFTTAGPDSGAHITIRHLLNHTSGLSDLKYIADLPDDATLEHAVHALSAAKPIAEPGAEFHYFNENYQTLGLVVEYVSSLSYADYIKQNIAEPLGLDNTYVDAQSIPKGVLHGYTSVFSLPVKKREPFVGYSLPDGYIASTANDMLVYLNAHNGTTQTQILSREGFDMLHLSATPESAGYAMGWEVARSSKGYTVIHHSGDLDTCHAHAVMIPEHSVNIVLLANQNSFAHSMFVYGDLIEDIVGVVMKKDGDYRPPKFRLYSLIAGAVLLVCVALSILTVCRLPKWRSKLSQRKKARGILSAALDLVLFALLLDGLPKALELWMGRGFSFREAFGMAPDLVVCLYIIGAGFALRAIAKIGFMAFESRNQKADENENAA